MSHNILTSPAPLDPKAFMAGANVQSSSPSYITELAEYLGPNETNAVRSADPEANRQRLAQRAQDLSERMGHLHQAMMILKDMMPSDAEQDLRAVFDMTCSYALSAANDTWDMAALVLVSLQDSEQEGPRDGR